MTTKMFAKGRAAATCEREAARSASAMWALAVTCCNMLLFSSLLVAAADARIDTDGPDFVESAEAVGKNKFQFEAGPAVQTDTRSLHNHQIRTTPVLLKFGVTEDIEARLETDGVTRGSGGSEVSKHGVSDLALGFKWHSHDRDSLTGSPAIAWIVHFELPTGSASFGGRGVRPSIRSVITWDLPHGFTIGLMPGIKYDSLENGRRYIAGIFGATAGYWWSSRFRTFIESSAVQIARAEDGGVLLYKDVGAAYLVTDTWQIGGRVAWSANRNTPTGYWLLSVAARF